MKYALFLSLIALAAARPHERRQNAAVALSNGQAAIAQNTKFLTQKNGDTCDPVADQNSCAGAQFAQCVNGKLLAQNCAPGTTCGAIPLDNAAGTLVQCTTDADRTARIAATGATAAAAPPPAAGTGNAGDAGANADPQKSLVLDPSVIAPNFANNGQDPPVAGQVASLTSTNNFINFCVGKTITNGKQVIAGSCDPAPIGDIPSTANMPSSKFVFPKNGGTVPANTVFTVQMAISKLITGKFVNAQASYFAAPQQLQNGQILGHSHVVIELLTSSDQTTATDPNKFAFFKGFNDAAVNGILKADVAGVDTVGLPAGAYRMCSINSSSNHQPAIVPIAQHGSLDDCSYFTSV